MTDKRPGSLRILIASSYYWPEEAGTAPYVTGMAEYLASRGHDVSVATTFQHYPAWTRTQQALARRETRNRVRIRRRWAYIPKRQSAVQRGMYEGSMLVMGLTAVADGNRPDVVVGFMPSLAAGILAATAARVHRRPYGLIIHDLLGPGAKQSGIEGGAKVAGVVRGIELSVARGAAGLAVIAEGFGAYYKAQGITQNISRVRTWTKGPLPTEAAEETRVRLGWTPSDFVCVHAGNMGLKQGLDNVLATAALAQASQEPRAHHLRFVLVGDGNERPRLESRAQELGLTNVSFLPVQEPGVYESVLQAADVLLVNQRPSVGDMSLPGKLTSYFAAARPVVAAVAADSETAREVEAAGAGVVVSPRDPGKMLAAIRTLMEQPSQRQRHATSAKGYAASTLRPEAILVGYERFIEQVAER